MVNQTLIRLCKEFELCTKDIDLPQIVLNFRLKDNNIYSWEVTMIGPQQTPYEGGLFRILILFPDNYPKKGPEFKFMNKIYHLNVDQNEQSGDFGHISMSFLNQWRVTGKVTGKNLFSKNGSYNIKKALFDIFCLFYYQNAESPYSLEMAELYRDNPEKFNEEARKCTLLYAKE